MKSLRRVLIRELVVIHAAVVVAVSLLAWFGLSRWATQQAQTRVTSDLRQVDRTLTDRFENLERLGDLLARWWGEGSLEPTRDGAAWRQLAPLVEPYPVLAGVNLVRTDGQAFGLGKLPAGWAARSIRSQDGRWISGTTFGATRDQVGGAPTPVGQPMDFRLRPWYRLGASLPAGRWTEPYLYVGRLEGQPGISYVRPVFSAEGELLGVMSLDVLLDAMTQVVHEIQPANRATMMVLDEAGRMVVPPSGHPQGGLAAQQPAFLQPLREADFPAAWQLLQAGPQRLQGLGLRHGWESAYGRLRPFNGARGLRWQLLLTLPSEDALADPLRRGFLVLVLGLLLTCGLAWRVWRLALQFADPLAQLEEATARLGQEGELALPVSDIRELRRLAEALQSAQAALLERDQLQSHLLQHQKLETVGTLAGGIAHDINNQLTAVLGQITLGRERLAQGLDPEANLQRAEGATQRCAETTKALLSFARPATSQRVSLDLNAVVRESAMLLKRGLGPSIRLDLELSPSLPPIQGDPVQLEQVILNLGMNARDALPAGGFIRMGTTVLEGREVLLWVEDNGIGMRPEVRQRIFEPFYTTKDVGQGSGLGLSMAHGITQAHDGTLEVDSEWGRGTTFRLRLPITDEAPRPSSESPALASGPWLQGRRLLVVEDEPGIRQVVQAVLERAGATCITCEDGEAGWAEWRQGPWDLVLSDHLMPRLTGLELLARIRQENTQLPVILASGRGLEGFEDRLAADPRLRLLPKPFHLNALLRTIRELLDA